MVLSRDLLIALGIPSDADEALLQPGVVLFAAVALLSTALSTAMILLLLLIVGLLFVT